MSRIDDLIAQHCPDGVPFRALGDVVSNLDSQRRPVTRSARIGGEYPYFGANGVQDFVDDFLFDGTFLLMGEDGSVTQRDGSPVLNWATGRIWVNNHAHVLIERTDELNLRFLYFYLQTVEIGSYVTGGAQPKLNQGNMNRIPVPVPPSEVQIEIVRILDTLAELEAELRAELEARCRQFEHYRHSLLHITQSERLRWAALGDLLEMRAGRFISAAEISSMQDCEHPVPCYGGGGLRGFVRQPSHKGERVLVGRQGALCGNVKRASGRFYATEHSVVVTAGPDVDVAWAFHMLSAMNLNQYASKSAQPGLAVGTLEKLRVPVPSLEDQQRVGTILDKLDALVNDLSIGLPAEIAARRQQYEHYRDRLLTFDELVA